MFCFILFCHEACGILGPWPEIEPAFSALEGEVLASGLPGKSQGDIFLVQDFECEEPMVRYIQWAAAYKSLEFGTKFRIWDKVYGTLY